MLPIFPPLSAMKWWDWIKTPWSWCFECWVLSQFFHSPFSLSSKGSLVSLHFLPVELYHLHIWGCWHFSQQSWFQLVILVAYSEWCQICDLWRRRFSFGTRDQSWSPKSFCVVVLLKWKGTEKGSDIDIRRGTESAPLASLSKGIIYFSKSVPTINQKNVSSL